jgi:hypothetical protein
MLSLNDLYSNYNENYLDFEAYEKNSTSVEDQLNSIQYKSLKNLFLFDSDNNFLKSHKVVKVDANIYDTTFCFCVKNKS